MQPDDNNTLATLEHDLAQAEEFLDTVYDQVPYVVFVYEVLENGDFRALRMNQAGAKLTGLAASYWNGKTPEEIVSPQDAAAVRTRLQAAVDQGQAVYFEEQLTFPSGIVWTQSIYSPVRNQVGRIYQVIGTAIDVTLRKRREADELKHREALIKEQASVLTELSTPLLTISDQVVVMPLIGTIDSLRAQRIMEALLHGIAGTRAQVAIIDITGVVVVDTQVANTLISAAQAVNLLGTKVALTGIRPEIAQTLVSLGVDLRGIMTYGTLQAGIAYALQH